jgi:hypothetical protein
MGYFKILLGDESRPAYGLNRAGQAGEINAKFDQICRIANRLGRHQPCRNGGPYNIC